MLINKSKESVEIKYNQKIIVVDKGKTLDVRDFGIESEQVLQVEMHILKKNPGVFDQKKTKDLIETNAKALERIEELEKENTALRENLEQSSKSGGSNKKQLDKIIQENEGYKEQNKKLKEEPESVNK